MTTPAMNGDGGGVISEAVRSVQRLGIRDWLIVVFVTFLLGLMYGQQRQLATMIAIHSEDSRHAYEAIEVIKNETIKSNLIAFADCVGNARGNIVIRDRCEKALEGIRSWR